MSPLPELAPLGEKSECGILSHGFRLPKNGYLVWSYPATADENTNKVCDIDDK
jgi:hypothetical protein